MKFKRMKRSSLKWEWMKKYPTLTKIYAVLGILWVPPVIAVMILWEEREQFIDVLEDIVGAIFMEDDLND